MTTETRPDPSEPAAEAEGLRERLLRAFESRLDQALAEDAPEGLPEGLLAELEAGEAEDGDPGLLGLWSALTALTQEVKLQGRAFKAVEERLAPLVEQQAAVLATHAQALGAARALAGESNSERDRRTREAAREAEERARREQLDVLVDLRERLARALGAAEAHLERARRGRLRRLWRALSRAGEDQAAAALLDGCRLGLERIDGALAVQGVEEIDCLGEPFDPHTMTAADVEETDAAEDGSVLDVYRPGWLWRGELLRPAQVKVARTRRMGGGA